MYRVTFQDKSARMAITSVAKNLAGSEYKDIFISRDLTYQQRQEIAAKRSRNSDRRGPMQQPNGGEQSNSNIPRIPVTGSNAMPIPTEAVPSAASSEDRHSAQSVQSDDQAFH